MPPLNLIGAGIQCQPFGLVNRRCNEGRNMDDRIVEGKQATYRLISRVVPPNPPGKIYIDTPVDLIAFDIETDKEVFRERYELRQDHNNEDLAAAFRFFTALAENDFERN